MTNQLNTTFYVGVTNNLLRRVYEHKIKFNESFTSKYNLTKLVYFELTQSIENAIIREKQIKNWKRQWKIELITKINPSFKDLSEEIGLTDDIIIALQLEND
jgi:putative endonuclease